jgi:spermidine/putrescine transport system substrate-binding protein
MKKDLRLMVMSFVLVVIASLMLAGIAHAADSKVLRIITWTGYAPDELIAEFEKETGIKVEVTYSSNEEIISKLRATRGGGFDLAQPSQDRITAVQQQYGIYQPIDYAKVNTAQIDANMLAAVKQNTLVDGKSYAVPHVYGTNSLVSNRAKVPDAKDWKDLLNPKYTGRVAMRLRRPVLVGMGYSFGYDVFKLYNDREGYQKFLDKMEEVFIKGKPVLKTYFDNADGLIALMRPGEVWLSDCWEQAAWKLHADNPDIDYLAPTSGPLAWIDTFAIPSKSENVDGAYKWINFSLRPENAALFTNKEKYGTASKDAVKYMDPQVKANFARSFPPEVMATIHWYPPVPPGLEVMEAKTLDKIRTAK